MDILNESNDFDPNEKAHQQKIDAFVEDFQKKKANKLRREQRFARPIPKPDSDAPNYDMWLLPRKPGKEIIDGQQKSPFQKASFNDEEEWTSITESKTKDDEWISLADKKDEWSSIVKDTPKETFQQKQNKIFENALKEEREKQSNDMNLLEGVGSFLTHSASLPYNVVAGAVDSVQLLSKSVNAAIRTVLGETPKEIKESNDQLEATQRFGVLLEKLGFPEFLRTDNPALVKAFSWVTEEVARPVAKKMLETYGNVLDYSPEDKQWAEDLLAQSLVAFAGTAPFARAGKPKANKGDKPKGKTEGDAAAEKILADIENAKKEAEAKKAQVPEPYEPSMEFNPKAEPYEPGMQIKPREKFEPYESGIDTSKVRSNPYANPKEVAEANAQKRGYTSEEVPQPYVHPETLIDMELKAEPFEPGMDFSGALNPYISMDKVKAANSQGLMGVSQMSFKKAKASKVAAASFDTNPPITKGNVANFLKTGDLEKNLRKATTVGEALDIVAPEARKQGFSKVLDALIETADKTISFISGDLKTNDPYLKRNIGVFTLDRLGNLEVKVRDFTYKLIGKTHGQNVETVLHEVSHSVTHPAIIVGFDTELSKNPKYKAHVQYTMDLAKLVGKVAREITKRHNANTLEITPQESSAFKSVFTTPDNWETVVSEFNAHGWTNPHFRSLLAKVYPDGKKSVLNMFVESAKSFFKEEVVQNKNAVQAVDAFIDRIGNIQGVDKSDIGQAAYRNYDRKRNNQPVRFNKDVVDAATGMMDDLGYIKDGYDLLDYARNKDIGDLGYAIVKDTPGIKQAVDILNRYFTTTNQTARIFKHPVLLWTVDHIAEVKRKADARIANYKNFVESVTDLSRKDQLTMFKILVDAQDPQLRPMWDAAVANGTEAAMLTSLGMPPPLVPQALKVLQVMQHLHLVEQKLAASLGRSISTINGYFPRDHSGTWKFKVEDYSKLNNKGEPTLVYIKGFQNAVDAQRFRESFFNRLKTNPDLKVSPVERLEIPSFMDTLGQMIVEEAMPDYLREMAKDIESKMGAKQRQFEMERAATNIGGYIGEHLYKDTPFSSGYIENNRLLDLLNNRIDDSYRFEVQTHLINNVMRPLVWNSLWNFDKPRLTAAMNKVLLKELGHETTLTSALDKKMQFYADEVGKWANKQLGTVFDYTPADVSMLSPTFVKGMAQASTWATSAWQLGMNIPVIAVNSLSIPMVAFDGLRTAFQEGVNPKHAVIASVKSMFLPWDADGRLFMKQAMQEGQIDPKISDLLTVTEKHGAKRLAKNLHTTVNFLRDQVEQTTNFTAVAYYYNFYKSMYPNANILGDGFKNKVYSAAKSWTGDYSDTATPQVVAQLGVAGRTTGNFSKWFYNQTGRFLDDLSTIRENPTKASAYMPLVANMSLITFIAGVYGLPIVTDYEYWRKMGQKTGWYDLKPVSAFYTEAQELSKKHTGVNIFPDALRRGGITEATDAVTRLATGGEESGPDVSGSLKHSPLVVANTVMYSTMLDAMTSTSKAMKWAWTAADGTKYFGNGFTEQDYKDFVRGLPAGFRNVVEDNLKVKRKDGKYITQESKNEAGVYAQSEFERKMDLLGFRSKQQNTAGDLRQWALYIERDAKRKVEENIASALNNLDKPELVKRNLEKLVEVGGYQALDNFANQLQDQPIKKAQTYDEREVQQLIKSKDLTSKREMLKIIQEMLQLKSRNTSLSH